MLLSTGDKFWSHEAIINEIMINGYTRNLCNPHHPTDIITLVFQYYQPLIPSFTKHILYEFNTSQHHYDPQTDKWSIIPEIQANKAVNIAIDKPFRILFEPDQSSKWCSNSKISLSDNTYSVRYDFSVKYIENMFNHSVIGIMHYDIDGKKAKSKQNYRPNRPYIETKSKKTSNYNSDQGNLEKSLHHTNHGYFLRINKKENGELLFIFKKYWSVNKWNLINPPELGNEIMSFTADCNTEHEGIISLSLNCSNWKLTFLFNNEIIHVMDVMKNKAYIPIVWLFNDTNHSLEEKNSKSIKYEIAKMSCVAPKLHKHKNDGKQVKIRKKRDVNRYVFKLLTFYYSAKYISNNNINSTKKIINLLWKGYWFIYLPQNVSSLTNVMTDMWELSKKELCMALEVYQCFYDEYNTYILSLLAQKQSFSKCVTRKICLILVHYIIDDYRKDYLENYDVGIEAEDREKIRYDDFDLKLWDNLTNPGCPTCYFGGSYQDLLQDYYSSDNENEECVRSYYKCNKKDRWTTKMVDRKYKNSHRKKKYRQRKRRKLQRRTTKKRRQDLTVYTKQIHKFVL